MANYIIRRLMMIPFMLIGISLIVFILVKMAPGDPIAAQYGLKLSEADPQKIARLREELGLNDPVMVQYVRYLGNVVQGNLGISITTKIPVIQEISSRLPATIELAVAAMAIVICFSIPLGVWAALKRGTLVDNFLMGFSLFGVSMPSFWLGMMLILLFGLVLGWLPVAGRGEGPLWMRWQYLIMPAFTLGFAMMGLNSRIMRSSMLEVLGQDYIRTAHAKGVKPRTVLSRHAIRNALIPIITLLGMQFASLLGGAVIIEMIFAWPGVGRLSVNATMRRDFPVILGTVLVFSFIYILANLLIDVVYTFLDPRIRFD